MPVATIIDGKKYMWDGVEREDEKEVAEELGRYESAGFEARLVREGGKLLLFTRKVITEVKVEGAPTV